MYNYTRVYIRMGKGVKPTKKKIEFEVLSNTLDSHKINAKKGYTKTYYNTTIFLFIKYIMLHMDQISNPQKKLFVH